MPAAEDSALISRCREGDEEAMRQLYQRHANGLYAMALRLVGRPADAEDVLQETFLRAWRFVRSFRGDSSVRTWLFRIAINASRDHARRRSRDRPEEVPEGAFDPAESATRAQIAAALRKLPEGYREVLVMHDVLGMEHAEIAQVLGVEVGTSKSQLHKARARMRGILAGGEAGAVDERRTVGRA